MTKPIGKLGYVLRELLNEYRFYLLRLHDKIFEIIAWLDKKESIAYWRKKDRGV